ncbi:glycosyltransferase [Providencia stuartii]|uniref:glycosyltransferase n=1 Tax=Providencia stuartii TaxID=588 RepID=UPI00370CF3E6
MKINDIAVIMSIYKNDKLDHINSAILSILQQTDISPLLYIYIDGTVSLDVYNYLDSLNENTNIHVTKVNENKGLAYALNYLIDKIILDKNIKYIARMDSDDISMPSRLNTQRNFLENNLSIDILGTGCEEFGTPYALKKKILPISHDELANFSITRCPFIHPSVMFRRRVFEQGNRYPTHTCFTEDMAFWLELLYKNYKFHNLPDILLRYRLEENTMTRRAGLSKAKSEVSLRLGYMFLLNKFSLKNMLLIYSRYCFHLLPPKIMSLAYKYLR